MAHDRDNEKPPRNPSRRSFIKGAGAAAAVAGILGVAPSATDAADTPQSPPPAAGIAERLGPGAQTIRLRVNGVLRTVTIEPRVTLLDALRDHLGLTGTKLVCDRGACGACTVALDGNPVTSCMMLAADARGHEITTIEGLGGAAGTHQVQKEFVAADAMQCGFCTPGMIMSVATALQRNPNASLDQLKRAVAGNTCRCGTYPHVFKAAMAAAAKLRGAKSSET
jgi:aerobic-type carbon monoxide dehydrogenase small subunit (CoxS/CutS family)